METEVLCVRDTVELIDNELDSDAEAVSEWLSVKEDVDVVDRDDETELLGENDSEEDDDKLSDGSIDTDSEPVPEDDRDGVIVTEEV